MSFRRVKRVKRVQAQCRYCGQWFMYEAKAVTRRLGRKRAKKRSKRCVCNACHEGRQRWIKKRTRPKRAMDFHGLPGDFTPRSVVAERTGLTPGQVEEMERNALDKLRSSWELAEAYRIFKQSGGPMVTNLRAHICAAVVAREEDRMLELQLQLVDYWQVHDLAMAVGMKREADEARSWIAQCHQKLLRELGLTEASDQQTVPEPADE